jgi:hypothetical protein
MSLAEIQRAVAELPADERQRLTAWIFSKYPILRVEDLMARAEQLVRENKWHPNPPTVDNSPRGKVLEHALRTTKQLNLDK